MKNGLLTREDIPTLEANKTTDAAIALNVMGWALGEFYDSVGRLDWKKPDGSLCSMGALPDFSSDIAAAFLVVEKMAEYEHAICRGEPTKELHKDSNFLTLTDTGEDWAATFGCVFLDDEWFEPGNNNWPLVAHAPAAPLAICRAAFLVIMETSL
jgi:hypothetical protein